jgi:hypothetical protein
MDGLHIAVPLTARGERRKHERFSVREGGITLLTPSGPVSTIVGHILDISTGGLSFRYISDEPVSNDISRITIASPESRFYLRDLPMKTVSDFEIAAMPFGSLSPRRHSIQFGAMTESQQYELMHFIRSHTDPN